MIRPEQPDDIGKIHELLVNAFDDAAEAELVNHLRSASRLSPSMVACDEQELVGYIGYSPVTINGKASSGLGLAPLAVSPSYQHLGFGGDLIRASLEACREAGATFVVVLGDPGYYRRFGFEPASNFGLTSEYDAGDAFMALELVPESLQNTSGNVGYAPEFAELS